MKDNRNIEKEDKAAYEISLATLLIGEDKLEQAKKHLEQANR